MNTAFTLVNLIKRGMPEEERINIERINDNYDYK